MTFLHDYTTTPTQPEVRTMDGNVTEKECPWHRATLDLLWEQYRQNRSMGDKHRARQWLIKLGEL